MSVSKESKPFEYFDSPDGEDIFPKLGVLLKPTALTALTVGTVDVLLWSHPKSYLATLGRYIHFGWPIFSAVGTFVVASNLAGSIRKKDDKWNWFIGGASSGAIAGVWKKNIFLGLMLAGLAGSLAAGKKFCVINNYPFLIPDKVNVQFGGLRTVRHDFTLMQERPRNWTTGEEK